MPSCVRGTLQRLRNMSSPLAANMNKSFLSRRCILCSRAGSPLGVQFRSYVFTRVYSGASTNIFSNSSSCSSSFITRKAFYQNPSSFPSIPTYRFHTTESKHSLKVWTIPNIICVARIMATPCIGYFIVHENFDIALYGFILAGISDGLDGYIARNFNQKSVLGSYLDPLSDKILINTLAVVCATKDLLPPWLVGIIVFRDCLLVGGATMLARKVTKQSGDGLFTGTFKLNSPLEIKDLTFIDPVLAVVNYTTACTTVGSLFEYGLNPGYVAKQDTQDSAQK